MSFPRLSLRWMSLAVLFVTPVHTAHAASRVAIDPNIVRALDTGLIGPFVRGTPQPGKATVLIELEHVADTAALGVLARAGVKLAFAEGKPLAYDRFVPADVTKASLAALAGMHDVKRVSLASARGPLPLDHSAELLRLPDARGARPAQDYLTGTGVLIADIDTIVDAFHPTFFKGDGGYYDWIDTDGDGVFTPGTDAIDLDQNGAADSSETAQPIVAATTDYYGSPQAGARSATWDPGTDWLYLDQNANGSRDYGAAAGFDDTVPAFGEPLFVPDDVNKNGKLDVGERVVRLGTSKFRKVYVNIEDPAFATNHVFQRGVDLTQIKVDITGGTLEGLPDALHATGVNTILVGDVPLVGRRWVGIAPDAEVDVVWDVQQTQQGMPIKGLTWALQDKPNVALFELAVWTGMALDGSDPLSTMIDTAVTKNNMTATCPTGDQGSALKHAHADLAAQANMDLAFNLPAHTKYGTKALSYIDLSVDVRGGMPETLSLHGPGGEVANLLQFGQGTFASGDSFYITTQLTPRGTAFYDVILYVDTNQPPFPTGTWTLSGTGATSGTLSVDAYVSDDQSSWAIGAAWDPKIATDAATVGVPSVADHCIAVNAAPDHIADDADPWYELGFYAEYNVPPNYREKQGELRKYSPLGPRIDGVQKPDITAPDNPWVANEHTPSLKYPYGSFSVFGGTSGASPHVTATAALLAQAGITGDAARDAIRAGAASDADTGATPNGNYGYGRLDAAAALGIKTSGVDPTVSITVSPQNPTATDKVQLTAKASAGDGNDAALQAKWDDGYDGTWDTDYAAITPHEFAPTAAGRYPFKVRVRNAAGHVAESVVWVVVGAPGSDGCGCSTTPTAGDLSIGGALIFLLGFTRRRR